MDTTRWGEGFPPAAQVPEGMGPVSEAADMPLKDAPQQDPDYPFEEPEMAPELREHRSESLYSRSTPFWDRVVELPEEGEEYPQDPEYWNHPEELSDGVMMRVGPERPVDVLKKAVGARATWYVVGVLAVAAALIFLVHSVFMTVRSITVEGNVTFTAEEVIALSQLEVGMSTFAIDEELVMERIARERYLRCTLVDVSYDRVVLHVRERTPVCSILQNGRLITLDDRGWVLEISGDMSAPVDGLITVHGLDVQHCTLGQAVSLRVPARLTTYTQILIELKALGGLDMITELDMTTMDSITLKAKDGFTIQLGNETRIHEKIRAMLVVHEVVLENGYYGDTIGGTIVVTDPASPAYRKPDAQ